jgi:hypothetical protein
VTLMAEYIWAVAAAHVGIIVNLMLLWWFDVDSADR